MERVLVVPEQNLPCFKIAKNGGFLTVEDFELAQSCDFYSGLLNGYLFFNRDKAEKDPDYKQIIPYVTIFSAQPGEAREVFCYKRTKKGGESRLHELWSLGAGGHIGPSLDSSGFTKEDYYENVRRELIEELGLDIENPAHFVTSAEKGVIYDNSTEVGTVHLGVSHFLVVRPNFKFTTKDPALSNGAFETIVNVKKNVAMFEKWSQIVIQNLL